MKARISLNLAVVNLTGGGLSGGYIKYLNRVLPLIKQNSIVSRINIYVPPQAKEKMASIGVSLTSWPDGDHRKGFPWLKNEIVRNQTDCVFIPTARFINFGQIPATIMVRNMEPILVPFKGNSVKVCLKNIARYVSALRACKCARRIIVVSNHVHDFLVKKWKIDPMRVGVVYHGVDSCSNFSYANPPKILNRHKISSFIFTAGSIRPARGLEDLIKAMSVLEDRHKDLSLIIAGDTDSETGSYMRHLIKLAKSLGVSERILWAGQLSESEMNWCYRNCSSFIMTSRVEACPNVALEAMGHSCLIVSTTQPPMPEIFENAAIYYVRGNSWQLAQNIHYSLELSEQERVIRRTTSLAIAAKFSWERTARLTIDQLILSL